MAALLRLLQLLRVAEQNEAPSGRRASQNVRQRHLARLIDEENVHGIAELLSAPEPGSTAEDIDRAALQALQRFVIRADFADGPAVGIGALLPVRTSLRRRRSSRGQLSGRHPAACE